MRPLPPKFHRASGRSTRTFEGVTQQMIRRVKERLINPLTSRSCRFFCARLKNPSGPGSLSGHRESTRMVILSNLALVLALARRV